MEDLYAEILRRAERGERVLVTTLTKKMAEDLTDYLREMGVSVTYLHSEVETLDRIKILRDLRLGVHDVLVGINLLREGLDLPEVSLVAVLDADKEGFLRSATSLVQTMGRAARHVNGTVILYADTRTGSIEAALRETNRRRRIQEEFNAAHGITPQSIVKPVDEEMVRIAEADYVDLTRKLKVVEDFDTPEEVEAEIATLQKAMARRRRSTSSRRRPSTATGSRSCAAPSWSGSRGRRPPDRMQEALAIRRSAPPRIRR